MMKVAQIDSSQISGKNNLNESGILHVQTCQNIERVFILCQVLIQAYGTSTTLHLVPTQQQ